MHRELDVWIDGRHRPEETCFGSIGRDSSGLVLEANTPMLDPNLKLLKSFQDLPSR